MDIVGLDLHKRASQLSSKADDGTITDRRIVTSRERLTAVFGDRPRARILLEASTASEWVARHLESLGHEVIVSDPNVAPMYATRSRRTTTDKQAVEMILHQPEQRRRLRTPGLVDAEGHRRRMSHVPHARSQTVERRAYGRPARGLSPWYCVAGYSDATSVLIQYDVRRNAQRFYRWAF
jgi:transposase